MMILDGDVTTPQGSVECSGAMFSGSYPRKVSINILLEQFLEQ